MTYPPQEIADRGIQAIRNYFIEYRANHDTLHELKLLLVGEERVGKTSIAKSLTIPDYQLEDEPSTEGIDIHTWIIPKEELNSEKDFRVNIWDFGGQEIYHATHQFFLTKRSLYLLVTATPQESDGKNEQQKHLYHWCNVIRLLGGQSPILVTLNKIDLPTRDVGIEEYYKLFDTIIHPFAQPISCHSSRRDTIESLKAEIKRILKDKTLCPNVGESLPKIWIDIRHALADLRSQGTDYITSDEYYVLCAEHGMAEEERANFLSDFLHDIGVILHFREDFDLSDLVVLNPEWVTNGVYKVLINPAIIAQQGRFHRSDLMVIWRGTDYYQYRHKLLALMLKGKFEICYALPDSAEEYLIPQLLPEREMAYAWRSDWHNLRFEYRYKFMPKGLLPRFIVKCHQQIYQRTHWRYGVLLDDDETRALVQEHPPAQKITIRLEGKNKRDMLYSIRKTIKEIHRSFNNLVVDEMIPCPCAECAARNEPHFYRYASLQRFIEKGRIHVMCEQSAEDVDIHSLLSDTVYAESRHDSRQLRHRLAECYPDELRIRRVLADAEIAAKRIRFDGDAESVWQAVLMEAENSGRLNALLDVVRSEYNINTSIKLRNINYD
ncbi:MAG: COR domain-containing protein [Chloroflexota bacterium]